MSNQAAWLTEKCAHPLKIDDAPIPEPKDNRITIRVRAVAINPVDWAIQAMGIITEKYPAIGGVDGAGEVVAVGPDVTRFKVGDRVAGCFDTEDKMTGQGTFQLYCNFKEALTAKLPDNISFTDGCVVPLGLCTASVALFEPYNLGLPFPQLDAKPAGKVVLIWGGSSSVGSCGIQAAKAAGLEVATTASAHNLEYCKSIGADYAFDYKKDSIVDDVVSALKGKEFAGAFSAVMGEEVYIKCAEIATQLGGKQFLASVLPDTMKYEKPLPGGVAFGTNWGDSLQHTAVGPAVLGEWLPAALANGSFKCKPDAHVVGQGLEKVQEACDLMGKGASATKYVVEFP